MGIEIIDFYDLKGNCLWNWERKKILREQEIISRKSLTKKIVERILVWKSEIPEKNISVKSVMMFLFDLKWNAYVVQRSNEKPENPWLWDKSIWWHVVKWDSYDKTAIKELTEELWITSVIIDKTTNIEDAIQGFDLKNKAMLKQVWILNNYISTRTTLSEKDYWYKIMNVWLYIWIYDWEVNFTDNEAQDKKMIPIELLKEEIENNRELYTEDMPILLSNYNILVQMLTISKNVNEVLGSKDKY